MMSYLKLDSPSSNYFHILLTFAYFTYTLLAVSADAPVPYDPSADIRSQSMLGFCDGEFYAPKSKSTCGGGINFGDRSPKCVCIKGAYQMHWDNCEVAAGFAEEVCTLLNDTVTRSKTTGIKLTKEFEWDKVGLVCNRIVGSGTEWEYVGNNGKAKLNSATLNFYTINGKALSSITNVKGKKTVQICVQQETRQKVICNYRHAENVDDWAITKATDMIVRDVCPNTITWQPLLEKQCFDPLTIFNSDCQVPCRKSNFFMKGSSGLGQIESLNGTADLEGDCTDPKGFFNHENHFMDRNLLMYMVLDQIRGPDDNRNISLVEPKTEGVKRTFILYNLVKQIAVKACEHPYLKNDTLQWASKFFMYLQKATKLQYEIKISDEDFKWIEVILKKCSARTVTMKLSAKEANAKCPSGQQEATGYCRPAATVHPSKLAQNDTTDADGNSVTEEAFTEPPSTECDYNEVKISQLYSNYKQKHYVPEYNWLFLDIVHMLCFADFKESYRMFHILEQVYEQLFTTPIRDYWHFPRWSTSTKTSMFTVEADTVMWNMQICAQSVYNYNQNILHRTIRPSRSKYPMRKKRAAERLSTSMDVSCAKTKSEFKLPQGCTKSKSP